MRPIKLVMKAFGPYCDTQVIDFRELKDKNMFLIHGKTGAGKTTIFDGISYALYGDSSGKERDGKSMRSQLADLDQLTEVLLEFEIRDKVYLISRIPQQQRPKKVGDGFTIQNTEATLWELREGEKKVLETMPSKVDEKIKEIIGFESNQFRQVIMIPQGQFRELLTAKSEERQEILAKIFRTHDYKSIESKLKTRAKDLKSEIDKLKEKENWILGQIKDDEIIDINGLIEENKDLSIIIDKVNMSIKNDEKKVVDLEKEIIKIEENIKKSQENLNKAKQNNEKINEKLEIELKIKKEESKREEIDKKNLRINKARIAKTLLESEKILKNRSEEKKEYENLLSKDKEDLEKILKSLELLKVQLKDEEDKEEYRNKLQKKVIELEGLYDKVKDIDVYKKSILNLEENHKKVVKDRKDIKTEIDKINNLIMENNTKLEKRGPLKDKYHEVLNLLQKDKDIYQKLKKLQELNKKHKDILDSCKTWEEKLKNINEKFNQAKEEYNEIFNLWNKGQASYLAKNLENGSPCPVCGSTDHPKKAILNNKIPMEKDVNYKKEILEHFQDKKESYKDEYNKVLISKNTIENTIIEISKEIECNKDILELKNEILEKEKNIKNIEENLKKLKEISIITENKKLELETLSKKYNEIDEKYQTITNDLNIKKGELNQLTKSVPSYITSKNELDKLYNKISGEYKESLKKYETIKNEYDKNNEEASKLKATIEVITKNLDSIKVKYNKEKEYFRDSLKNEGFENYNDYDSSKLKDEEISILEEEVIKYREVISSLKDRYNKLSKETKDLSLVDIEKLIVNLESIQKSRDHYISTKNNIRNKLNNNKQSLNEVIKNSKLIRKKEDKYKIIGELSEVANGKNLHGLTFERFVLSALLDDIIRAANLRLLKMSSGRYELNRTLDRDRKNAQGGLELEVFDNDTGMNRHVSTLSGGEGFKASLSLALGLADVVESYSGGISLDTIFIDEGFGTLDPESLDYAIKTLIDLQKDGRLVGIISHVPELKERIDARLEVISTSKGSVARFNVL